MSDQGFDFQKQLERRERASFEIPPWEKDAFDALQREAQESDSRSDLIEAAQELEAEITPEPAVGPESVPEVRKPAVATSKPKGPSEAEVLVLMAGLAEEEPSLEGHFTRFSLGVALLLGPFGMVLIVWGMAAFAKAQAAGGSAGLVRTAGAGLAVFGAGFVAGAFWTVYRVMKQRGVL